MVSPFAKEHSRAINDLCSNYPLEAMKTMKAWPVKGQVYRLRLPAARLS